MIKVYKQYFFVFVFLSLRLTAQAQPSTNFERNIIKVKGKYNDNSYGFIIGSDKKSKSVFFIKIQPESEKSRFAGQLTVLVKSSKGKFNKETLTSIANLVQSPLKINIYSIGIYEIKQELHIEDKYFHSISGNSGNDFYVFTDQRKPTPDQFYPFLSSKKFSFTKIIERNLFSQSIFFEARDLEEYALSGTPIINENGDVTAIIVENQDLDVTTTADQKTIVALDITAIQQALSSFGEKYDNDPCKYFNLIERGSNKDETPCERKERLEREVEERRKKAIVEEERRKRAIAEERARQLRQDSLKHIFDMYKEGNREKEVVRIYNMHRDRPFTITIGGTGFATLLIMNVAPNAGAAKTNSTSSGYSFGGNFYLNPDRGHLRVVFKPRYSYIPLSISENYRYEATSDFGLNQINLKSYELTVMPELVFKRLDKGDNFFSIGYGVAKHTSTNFSYKSAEKIYTEPILGYKVYSRHGLAEIGSSRGRIRYSLVVRYELTSYTRENYEFIVNGKSVLPLRDVPKHYWTYGIDFQLRLWNRWKNDYRTMF